MSKVTKKDRIAHLEFQVAWLTDAVHELQGTENLEYEPQLKQLDQSVFDGAYKIWRFASVDADGAGFRFAERPELTDCFWRNVNCSRFDRLSQSGTYDASNWQNSLIERDTAKELLEVDLSSELTGSELCKAMLARGDKYISGFGHHHSDALALQSKFADTVSKHTQCFQSSQNAWDYFVPINNQGEPLTAREVGL